MNTQQIAHAKDFSIVNSLSLEGLEEFRTEIYRLVETGASIEEVKASLTQLASRHLTTPEAA